VGEGGVVLRNLEYWETVGEESRLELAYTLVALVGAPHTTFEELFSECCAMFCFSVPSVREVGDDVSELHVCACV
jgi:hypothetical protein